MIAVIDYGAGNLFSVKMPWIFWEWKTVWQKTGKPFKRQMG